MAETIKEEDKIHSYVTWPESRPIFDDGRGGLAFPEQNNSKCPDGNPITMHLDFDVTHGSVSVTESSIVYAPSYNVVINNDFINLKLKSFKIESDVCTVVLNDAVSEDFVGLWNASTSRFVANTADTLDITRIPECIISGNIEPVGSYPCDTFTFTTNIPENDNDYILTDSSPSQSDDIPFDLYVSLNLPEGGVYIDIQNQLNSAENGVYFYSEDIVYKATDHVSTDDTEDPYDIVNNPTVNDNVPCCDNYRKTYSHREVHDYTDKKVGEVTSFGTKSMSISDCDGGFIDWFTTDGQVNIGNGKSPLFVSGFGLGRMYKASFDNSSAKDELPKDDYDENDGTLHPWLKWAYGTRWDSETSTNISALPRDWPFTHVAETESSPVFKALTDTSNITLVKHADIGDADGLGNLEFNREIEQDDPDAEPEYDHVFINRHHVVLYPNYEKIVNKDGYEDGAVVVKPLFIHLPATLDTKDGETVDITVSIQNVNPQAFGDADSVEAMSGYYAAMSQPRVYVMGGIQKFSNKKLPITSVLPGSGDGYTLISSVKAMSNDGSEALPWHTAVRANIVVSSDNGIGDRRTFTAHGLITSYPSDMETRIEFNGTFPYHVGGRGWNDKVFTICGMAYLDDDDNPTLTKMGLVSRSEDVLRGDAGTGDEGVLNQYNKFYAVESDEAGRTQLEHSDKRYVLATVYQTATSTFPWALNGRRKLAHIGSSWTDEFETGSNSLLHMIYEQNKKMIEAFKTEIYGDGDVSIDALSCPVSYMTGNTWTSLGSVVRVVFPTKVTNTPVTRPYGNPVRQASKAINMFISDFLHMRMLSCQTNPNQKARVKIGGIDINSEFTDWPAAGTSVVGNTNQPNETDANAWQKEIIQSAWNSNLRSLPEYVTKADSYTGELATSIPSLFTSSFDDWFDYVVDSPYGLSAASEYDSSACTDEEPCTVTGTPDKCVSYSTNSVIDIWTNTKLVHKSNRKLVSDIRRYAETVLALKINDDYMDLKNVGNLADGRIAYDWANPFTNISSIDSTPVPKLTGTTVADALATAQYPFMSSDAVQMYRFNNSTSIDKFTDVSTVMPTSDALAEFIRKYVTAFGSGLAKHIYQGNRVLLHHGELPVDTDPIYIRTIERVKRMHNCTDIVNRYIDDNFAYIEGTTRDPNFDRAYVNYPSVSISVPPYVDQNKTVTVETEEIEVPKYANETYTRVFMQFTFSQKAGRWYTTDYRQYPTNYLSPLYGNDAISQTWKSVYDVDGTIHPNGTYTENLENGTTVERDLMRPLWRNSACSGFNSYRSHLYTPYSRIPPMDITLGCVPFLADGVYNLTLDTKDANYGNLNAAYDFGSDITSLSPLRYLERPYKTPIDGGIGLYPPANVNGGHTSLDAQAPTTDNGIHANFWSVRKYIRPAVSVLPGTDIPPFADSDRYGAGGADPENDLQSRYGGNISDPTLYSMFDFPRPGEIEYALPNEVNPEVDMAKSYLLYHTPEGQENPGTDVLKAKTGASTEKYLGYGVGEYEQEIDRD